MIKPICVPNPINGATSPIWKKSKYIATNAKNAGNICIRTRVIKPTLLPLNCNLANANAANVPRSTFRRPAILAILYVLNSHLKYGINGLPDKLS